MRNVSLIIYAFNLFADTKTKKQQDLINHSLFLWWSFTSLHDLIFKTIYFFAFSAGQPAMEPSAIELVLNPSATSFRAVAMGVDISLPCTVFFFFTPPTPHAPQPNPPQLFRIHTSTCSCTSAKAALWWSLSGYPALRTPPYPPPHTSTPIMGEEC